MSDDFQPTDFAKLDEAGGGPLGLKLTTILWLMLLAHWTLVGIFAECKWIFSVWTS